MQKTTDAQRLQRCIKDCQECTTACLRTASHCLGMGGDHAAPEHQTLLQDCAHVCGTAAGFMSRGSHHHAAICRACAEICHACADDCDRLAGGDTTMQKCVEACRRCAESCETMATASV